MDKLNERKFDSERVLQSLKQAVEYTNGDTSKAKAMIRHLPDIRPVKKYKKDEIREIRINANLTQYAFADILGVSVKTVESWETGSRTPIGSASRLIEMLENDKSILNTFFISQNI